MAGLGVLDVGGSHATVAVVDLMSTPPRIRDQRRAALDSTGSADGILSTLSSLMRVDGIDRWMLAFPGPFDYERGSGTFEGVGKFEALAGLRLKQELARRLGLESSAVRFVNDAAAYATGEWWISPARADRFVCVTLGTGVGSAFLDHGHVVDTGDEVPRHGWVHLLEIDGRPLEQTVSTAAIGAAYRRATGLEASVREIAQRARDGDPGAVRVVSDAMKALGVALAPWVHRFGATDLVVGGSMARSWDVLGAPLFGAIERAGGGVRVRRALEIDGAPLIGAAVRAEQGAS